MPTPPALPAPRRVRALVFRLARTFLEVERGLRPREHLEPYLTDSACQRLDDRLIRPATIAAPTAHDLGRVHVAMPRPNEITATVPARETDDRWTGLVLHVTHAGGQWKIDQIERVTPELLRDQHRTPDPPAPENIDARIRRTEAERATIAAAQRATQARLDDPDIDGRTRVGRTLKAQADRWAGRRDELDQELATLRRRREFARQLPGSAERVDTPATRLTKHQIRDLLGNPPADPTARGVWRVTIDNVQAYRQLWGITDPSSLIGPAATCNAQQQHRDHVASLLRTVASDLVRLAPWASQNRDHDHDVALER